MGRLSILDMVDFDIILVMDWLSPYHAILNYFSNIVTLSIFGNLRLD